MSMGKNTVVFVGLLWVAVTLAGCALFSFTPPEEVLRERVTDYMQARVDCRWGDVYNFFDSEYKNILSRDQFLGMSGPLDFLAFKIESIEVAPSEKEAIVMLRIDVEVRGFTFKDTPEKQTWVKDGRTWYIKISPKPKTPFEQ